MDPWILVISMMLSNGRMGGNIPQVYPNRQSCEYVRSRVNGNSFNSFRDNGSLSGRRGACTSPKREEK